MDLDWDSYSDSDSDSDSVEVWLRLHLHAQHFQMTITNLFCCTLFRSTFLGFPSAGNYFLISSLIAESRSPSHYLSLDSTVIADKFVKNGCHCCLFTARKPLVSVSVDPLTY